MHTHAHIIHIHICTHIHTHTSYTYICTYSYPHTTHIYMHIHTLHLHTYSSHIPITQTHIHIPYTYTHHTYISLTHTCTHKACICHYQEVKIRAGKRCVLQPVFEVSLYSSWPWTSRTVYLFLQPSSWPQHPHFICSPLPRCINMACICNKCLHETSDMVKSCNFFCTSILISVSRMKRWRPENLSNFLKDRETLNLVQGVFIVNYQGFAAICQQIAREEA